MSLVRWLAITARGCLPPLVTAVGGFAAQEAITTLTGKFTPLRQWVSTVEPLYKDTPEIRTLNSLNRILSSYPSTMFVYFSTSEIRTPP